VHTPQQTEADLHRVILFASQGEELLVLPGQGRIRLPDVSMPRHQRIAEHLTASVCRDCSQDAISLFSLSASSTDSETRYEVMESTGAQRSDAAGLHRVSLSSLRECQFEESADARAVARAIAECEEYAAGSKQGPFGRLGWFAELTEWVRGQIRPSGLTLNGRFRQINASPTFSLVRFETNGPAVWFKAVGEPNLREYAITLALSNRFPAYTPHVLAAREDWNGWLALEVEGTHPTESSDLGAWMRVATALGQLQIASSGQTLHLIHAGCRDLRVCSLVELVEPFLQVVAELMAQQTKTAPAPLSRKELFALQMQLEDLFADPANSAIPHVLGHIDFNSGNIVVSNDCCEFLDWAEACVGHPFLTFQYLLEDLHRFRPHDRSWRAALTSAYVEHWRSLVSSDQIVHALTVSPLLAVFAYAVSCDAWRNPGLNDRLETAALLRSLTRRMKREADALTSSRIPCIS
jgi:Phosphotransferase enzyme family